MKEPGLSELKQVVDGNFCIGCGACSFVSKTPIQINAFGEYEPNIALIEKKHTKEIDEKLKIVCPMLAPELNETVLAKELYANNAEYDPTLGYYEQSYAGYVLEDDFRENGTSGGMGTWLAVELLKKGLIDGVIHVKQVDRKETLDPFYKYAISSTVEEAKASSKTRYHIVEMSEILQLIEGSDKKYLFIGVPCMCKSIRRLQTTDKALKEKIPFVFSLVCGHLKSINWSLSLVWGAGVKPQNVAKIQYRTKGKDIPARAYVFRVEDKEGNVVQKDSAEVVGGKFNAGALMLPGCEFCDDVIGETADITIGDAWLPKFEADDNGTNLLVVRSSIIHTILKEASSANRIKLDTLSKDEAIASQSGGYRQRKEGLAYRLYREESKGRWLPKKRVEADGKISKIRAKIYDLRTEVTSRSRDLFKQALEQNDYMIYKNNLEPLTKKLRKMEILSNLSNVLLNKLQRYLFKLIKKNN